jgi:hypothetical protein
MSAPAVVDIPTDITLVEIPGSVFTCRNCAKPLTADHADPNHGPDHDDAIWRDASGYGVCPNMGGQVWHQPAEDHPAVKCSWLARCSTCTPWAVR